MHALTRTHTANHLSDVIMSSVGDILAALKINTNRFYSDWTQDCAAISAWIEEGTLKTVALECHRPDGVVKPVFDFDVSYTNGGVGDRKFVADNASLLKYMAKLDEVPAGTTYRLFCSFNSHWHSPQAGWSPGSKASTSGLRSRTVGTLAGGPDATATTRIHS
ncbi:hypothetical protein [Solicola sp. PLA-1-18]|uniref:hypothetical protein n=1 Tax=Solicola sp. PLA-1-18 TaxID=3380532 RepID=UPI003B79AA05